MVYVLQVKINKQRYCVTDLNGSLSRNVMSIDGGIEKLFCGKVRRN